MNLFCPLCHTPSPNQQEWSQHTRTFLLCSHCDLLFVAPSDHPSQTEEKARYLQHKNSSADAGYKNFLSRIYKALEPFLQSGMIGLDYGCGPSPIMTEIFHANGYPLENYDPFFGPALRENVTYDFITCCEVVEHFRDPRKDFELLCTLLRTDGYLAISTGLRNSPQDDPDWWYLRDLTHLCFYSNKTFEWIAKYFGVSMHITKDEIVIFSKNGFS